MVSMEKCKSLRMVESDVLAVQNEILILQDLIFPVQGHVGAARKKVEILCNWGPPTPNNLTWR